MKAKKKEHINLRDNIVVMNRIRKTGKAFLIIIILMSFTQCKTQDGVTKAPFDISEMNYFYFAGGKKGISGTTIKVVGQAKTLNLYFSTIFFQNHEYKIVPEFNGGNFVLVGTKTKLKDNELNMNQDALSEYGNKAPVIEKKIPFDLENNEAILVYRINGKDYYYKLKDIQQLDDVYYP